MLLTQRTSEANTGPMATAMEAELIVKGKVILVAY